MRRRQKLLRMAAYILLQASLKQLPAALTVSWMSDRDGLGACGDSGASCLYRSGGYLLFQAAYALDDAAKLEGLCHKIKGSLAE